MRTALRLALAAALFVLTAATIVRAETVQDWMNPSNYPARVNSMQLGSSKLDRSSSVRFGAWTVHFANQPPSAQFESDGDCRVVTIHDLTCSNAMIGNKLCTMAFIVSGCGRASTRCGIGPVMVDDFKVFPQFEISCPTNLDLAR